MGKIIGPFTYKLISLLQGSKSVKSAAISDFQRQPEIESIQVENYNGNVGDTQSVSLRSLGNTNPLCG